MVFLCLLCYGLLCLNESPSEKEGKYIATSCSCHGLDFASMKALPKRKGNITPKLDAIFSRMASMKALPKRKGNSGGSFVFLTFTVPQ